MTAVGRFQLFPLLVTPPPSFSFCMCASVSVSEKSKTDCPFFFNLCKITSDSTVFLPLLLTKGRNIMK